MTTDPAILVGAERGAPVSRARVARIERATGCNAVRGVRGGARTAIVAVRRAWGRTGPRARSATPRATEIAAMGVRHAAPRRSPCLVCLSLIRTAISMR